METGMPEDVVRLFHSFNRSQPTLPKEGVKLDEHDPQFFEESRASYKEEGPSSILEKPSSPLTGEALVNYLVSKARSPKGLFSIGQSLLGEDFSHVIKVMENEMVLALKDGGSASIELS
jgi:hypothetical protein